MVSWLQPSTMSPRVRLWRSVLLNVIETLKKEKSFWDLGEDHGVVNMQRSKEPIVYLYLLVQVNGKSGGIWPLGIAGSRCSGITGYVS